jgi:hypothetical protein
MCVCMRTRIVLTTYIPVVHVCLVLLQLSHDTLFNMSVVLSQQICDMLDMLHNLARDPGHPRGMCSAFLLEGQEVPEDLNP